MSYETETTLLSYYLPTSLFSVYYCSLHSMGGLAERYTQLG